MIIPSAYRLKLAVKFTILQTISHGWFILSTLSAGLRGHTWPPPQVSLKYLLKFEITIRFVRQATPYTVFR